MHLSRFVAICNHCTGSPAIEPRVKRIVPRASVSRPDERQRWCLDTKASGLPRNESFTLSLMSAPKIKIGTQIARRSIKLLRIARKGD